MTCPVCADARLVSVAPVHNGALDFTAEAFVECIACLTNIYAGEQQ